VTLSSTGVLGTVIGPLGTRQLNASGVSAYTNNVTVKYDVAIGGVPFMLKPSPDTPYQRTTAPFRKQQFDAEASVGEQSLDGFWRRSQLSFHQGAGIKYLDAFSEDVSARAWQMEGVDPWTPGEVSLGPSFAAGLTAAHSHALPGYDGSTVPVVWFRKTSDSNKLHKWDGTTDSAVSAAGVTAFAPDPNLSGRCFYDSGVNVKTSNAATTIAHLSAGTWKNLWWAKQRLIGLDDLGNFYAIVANPPSDVAITQGSTGAGYFWNGNARTDSWVLADSPAAIFLGYGRTIYKVVLDDNGAVPVLAGGVVAAELPTDETVLAMRFYLGFLVIVTNLGPRVATVSADGSLTYGPRLFDLESSNCRVLAASGSRVWLTGTREDDAHSRVFAIDLAQPTADGAYGWAVEADVPLDDSAGSTGVIVFGGGIAPWDGAKVFLAGTAASRTGFLQTGYIRLGTMEPKAFHSVRIKLDGAGSVSVILVRRGETETVLTNIAASSGVDENIPLNLPAPEEFVGLKFQMTADAATGESPILLGYQMKALPAPVRNRLIQYPLSCYDQELTSGGVTFVTPGAAPRLFALEEMEETAGIIVVQDFRPGVDEQFLAFVEEVQFFGTSPPFQGEANFGGTALVTLRKV
jgi:hypothetical protein